MLGLVSEPDRVRDLVASRGYDPDLKREVALKTISLTGEDVDREKLLQSLLDEAGKIQVAKLNGFAFVLGEFWTFGHKLERA